MKENKILEEKSRSQTGAPGAPTCRRLWAYVKLRRTNNNEDIT